MKQKLKKIALLSMLSVISLVFLRCQSEENAVDKTPNKIQTVTFDEAKDFLKDSKNNSFSKSANNQLENLEFDKITQENINGSDQLLTVIPFATNNDLENDRILLLKIENEIKSVIFKMYPDENSVKGSFSGKLLVYSIDGNFINGFRAKDGFIVTQFVDNDNAVKNNSAGKSAVQLKEVVVQNNYRNTVNALDVYGSSSIFGNDIYGGASSNYGGVDYYSWDAGGESYTDSISLIVPPSCESFNFTSKKGANWQEAAVRNITLRIVVLTQNRVEVTNTMIFPQAVLFGMPINYSKGNGDVTAGAAATVSAMVLNETMKEMAKLYTRTLTNELTLRTKFQELLINNYRVYTNGGTVNFNSTSTLSATNYKTNPRETGLCDN